MTDSNHISVPQPVPTDTSRIEFATEVAYNTLMMQAKRLNLVAAPTVHLVYLGDPKLVQDFKEACRNILLAAMKRP